MELRELLAEFRREDLRRAVIDIRKFVARENPSYKFTSQHPPKTELIEYFKYRATLWDETTATSRLQRINQTNILIENPTQVPIAIILGLLTTDMLEQVAKKYDINTSNKLSTNKGLVSRVREGVSPPDWVSGGRRIEKFPNRNNSHHWYTVSKLAEFAAENYEKYPIEGIHSFCPDCKEDNPKEADHCISCGRELPQITCPKCETANPPQAKFCMGCGEER